MRAEIDVDIEDDVQISQAIGEYRATALGMVSRRQPIVGDTVLRLQDDVILVAGFAAPGFMMLMLTRPLTSAVPLTYDAVRLRIEVQVEQIDAAERLRPVAGDFGRHHAV